MSEFARPPRAPSLLGGSSARLTIVGCRVHRYLADAQIRRVMMTAIWTLLCTPSVILFPYVGNWINSIQYYEDQNDGLPLNNSTAEKAVLGTLLTFIGILIHGPDAMLAGAAVHSTLEAVPKGTTPDRRKKKKRIQPVLISQQ